MKKFKASTLLVATAITLGLATAGAGVIHAASNTSTNSPMNNIVNALAQKFNLKTSDVQQVFDEQHTQMQAQRLQAEKDRLAQAVTAGTITQAQADLITAKQAEMKTFMDSLQGKTPSERQTAMKTQMDSLKQWATQNNIPQQFMMLGMGHGRGHHMGFNRNQAPAQVTQPTTTTAN